MTSIVAIRQDNKIYIASDGRLTGGMRAVDHKFCKLLTSHKNGFSVIATAGYAADITISRDFILRWTDMITDLQSQEKFEAETHLEYLKRETSLGGFVINFLDEFLAYRAERWKIIDEEGAFEGGSDNVVAGPSGLFMVDAHGFVQPIKDFVSIGSGSPDITSFLDLNLDKLIEEGVSIKNIIRKAIKFTCKRDGGSNTNISIHVVTLAEECLKYAEDYFDISEAPGAAAFYEGRKAYIKKLQKEAELRQEAMFEILEELEEEVNDSESNGTEAESAATDNTEGTAKKGNRQHRRPKVLRLLQRTQRYKL